MFSYSCRQYILACGLFALSIPASAATTLLFDVAAERYTARTTSAWAPLGEQWVAEGGEYRFQLAVTLNELAYQFIDYEIPPENGYVNYSRIGSVPLIAVAGGISDEIGSFTASSSVTANASSFGEGFFNEYSIGSRPPFNSLRFTNSVVDRNVLGTDSNGMERVYVYEENLSLTRASDGPLSNSNVPSFSDYLSLIRNHVDQQNAYYFEHEVFEGIDECTVDACGSGYAGYALEATGFRYAGTATLVGVSEVPLPAAAWLYFSALAVLGYSRRKAAALR